MKTEFIKKVNGDRNANIEYKQYESFVELAGAETEETILNAFNKVLKQLATGKASAMVSKKMTANEARGIIMVSPDFIQYVSTYQSRVDSGETGVLKPHEYLENKIKEMTKGSKDED